MKKSGYLYILIAGVMWGITPIFVRQLAEYGFNSLQLIFARALITAVVFGVISAIKRMWRIKLKDVWVFVGTGLLSFVFFNFWYFKAILISNAGQAAVLLYTAPIFVMIMSALIFKEKVTKTKILSLAVVFVGCIFVSLKSVDSNLLGIFAGLLSGFGYALYSIFGNIASKKYITFTITFYTFLLATLCSGFLCDVSQMIDNIAKEPVSALWLTVLAVVTTVLPYFFYTEGLKTVEPGKAAVTASIEPVVATLVSVLYFSENAGWLAYLGIILVILGVLILNLKDN